MTNTLNKLWLWKNFVDGKPEYWAFDNQFPICMDCDDPQTLGEPCGYALFKPSRNGRPEACDGDVATQDKTPLTDAETYLEATDTALIGVPVVTAAFARQLELTCNQLREELASLLPKPPKEGIYEWVKPLESVRRHADFWIGGGRRAAQKGIAILCVEQAVNSWKNACYSYAEKLAAANEQLAIAQAKCVALEKDAARYQWLRGRVPGSSYRIIGITYSEGGAGVDIAIDAVIAAANTTTKEGEQI